MRKRNSLVRLIKVIAKMNHLSELEAWCIYLVLPILTLLAIIGTVTYVVLHFTTGV